MKTMERPSEAELRGDSTSWKTAAAGWAARAKRWEKSAMVLVLHRRGMSFSQIGEVFECDHVNVLFHLRRAERIADEWLASAAQRRRAERKASPVKTRPRKLG